jgi:Flp pilus assembly protein TadG
MSRDRGSIAPLVPIVLFAILLLGGLVVDGARDLNARSDAQGYAEEAARAGATAVNLSAPELALDEDGGSTSAQQYVANYCAAIKAKDSRVQSCGLAPTPFSDTNDTCDGTTENIVVNTVVKMKVPTTLLGLIGVTTMSATGDAKARPFEGIDAADAC